VTTASTLINPAACVCAALLLAACEAPAPASSTPAAGEAARPFLSADFLTGGEDLMAPVPTSAFEAVDMASPSHRFEGRLNITIPEGSGHMEGLLDWFDILQNPELEVVNLPPFSFEFIQDGEDLLPFLRGPQSSAHPYWEFILEPGKVWDEAGDGGYSRASIPFSLQQRNANCTHNGLMTFLFRSDGSVSRVAYQVASETCQYLQLNLWGVLAANYQPEDIDNGEALIRAFREEVAARLPVKRIEALAEDYPGIDPGQFKLHEPGDVSTYGFVIGGVHYSGGCNTRFGPYPYCDVLDLPSYSLAKTVFAGTVLMWLEQHYPGAEDLLVTDYVPECRADDRWEGVTLEHLLDMSSGNYESIENQVDEFASYGTDFIAAETHAGKIETSCTLFPRKSEPGSTFVYHSSDAYIAGALMNAFLREQAGSSNNMPDIHSDILVEEVMNPLRLSPVTRKTRRSYDETAQPFTGFGLTFHSDDIARFALFMMNSAGMIDGRQVLSPKKLKAALQQETSDPGLSAHSEQFRYNNGLWSHDISEFMVCKRPQWIPYMSGYGGISVALIPNNTVYYVFSDGGQFKWAAAAVESNKIHSFCEKK
jgi:hypothetical protein